MTFWIIRDGDKTGPFEDYEVREMIRSGKVGSDSRVWFDGAEGWEKASEVELLKGEFTRKSPEPPPLPKPREPFRPWRRFGARFYDSFLYSLILAAVARLSGVSLIPEPGSVPSVWFIIGTILPAILIEAALVSSVGMTPGKWLLRMRVETLKGGMLTTGQAFVRSMRVWILGMGMRQPILMALGHILSLWFGLKRGVLLWDLQSGFEVSSAELSNRWLYAYGGSLLAMFAASLWLVWPEVGPAWEEILEEARRKSK